MTSLVLYVLADQTLSGYCKRLIRLFLLFGEDITIEDNKNQIKMYVVNDTINVIKNFTNWAAPFQNYW